MPITVFKIENPEYDKNLKNLEQLGADAYETDRARALYAAMAASMNDEELALYETARGEWVLLGLTARGHRYAIES